MRIASYQYSEYVGQPREWSLAKFDLELTNLFVGRNSSGKSRLLSTINGLARVVRGEQRPLYDGGSYEIELFGDKGRYKYEVVFEHRNVIRETLLQNDVEMIRRNSDGTGYIWSEKEERQLEFAISRDVLVVSTKRDRVQHPYLEGMFDWASKVSHFEFGSSLGRTTFPSFSSLFTPAEASPPPAGIHGVSTQAIYNKGFEAFGERFDEAILHDLAALGYECTDVGIRPMLPNEVPEVAKLPQPLVTLFVQESHLQCETLQLFMSQGMFRALSLVIHLNYILFSGSASTLLIDDIGEGLDFERSKQFVSLLIERSEAAGIQILMTTNDRFVMNGVPLKSWGIIERTGHNVKVINHRNSPEAFDEFKHVGLSNFDFFATRFFDRTSP